MSNLEIPEINAIVIVHFHNPLIFEIIENSPDTPRVGKIVSKNSGVDCDQLTQVSGSLIKNEGGLVSLTVPNYKYPLDPMFRNSLGFCVFENIPIDKILDIKIMGDH